MGRHNWTDNRKAKDAFSECWLLHNKEVCGSPGEELHLIMSAQGAVWSCNIYYKSWLALLCTFSFSLPSNPPLTPLLSSRIWKEIIKPHSCYNSSCLQGSLGSPCQFLCCAGLLGALMHVPGSSPLSQLLHKVVCRLCKRVERSESAEKGTAWLIGWISCVRESYSFRYYGASPSFSLSCISVRHFGSAWFFCLYLFPSPFTYFPLCFSVSSPLFLFSFSLSLPCPPTFVKSFRFLLILFIYSLSLNFLTYLFSFSFFLLFFLNCFSSFLPSLPDLLYSAVFCAAPFSLPTKSPLHYSLSPVAGAAAVAIWDPPGGVEWGGGQWCWGGAVPHVLLPPCKQEEQGSACAGLETMAPVNRMGEFHLNVGMSHENWDIWHPCIPCLASASSAAVMSVINMGNFTSHRSQSTQ